MIGARDFAIWTGGTALLAATAIDTFAVIGRSIDFPLHGSIEMIQAAILVAGGLALAVATASDNHARVRLIVERMPRGRDIMERLSDILTGLFFTCLLGGSVWLSWDLWNSHEISEIVGVPWRWLRLFANLCLAAVIVIVVRGIVRGRER